MTFMTITLLFVLSFVVLWLLWPTVTGTVEAAWHDPTGEGHDGATDVLADTLFDAWNSRG